MSLRIDNLYYAASELERAADWLGRLTTGWEARDRVASLRQTAREAQREYSELAKVMPDVRAYIADKAAQYDRYVTRHREWEDGGCSCHINPPCGFCTRQSDEDDDESSPAPGQP